MHQIRRSVVTCLTIPVLALLVGGCPREEPAPVLADEEASDASSVVESAFEVRLNRFDVVDWAPAPASQEGESAAEAEAAAMGGEEAMGEDYEEGEEGGDGPRTAKIMFDLLVRFDGPGVAPEKIGVEFTHESPVDGEKGRYRQALVTHEMQPGEIRQEPFELEIPDFEEGDTFSVEYRATVPPPVSDWEEWATSLE